MVHDVLHSLSNRHSVKLGNTFSELFILFLIIYHLSLNIGSQVVISVLLFLYFVQMRFVDHFVTYIFHLFSFGLIL